MKTRKHWEIIAELYSHTVFHGQRNSPDKNTGMGNHSLLQEIFLTQGSNPGLLHGRQILYCLSHQRSLKKYIFGEKLKKRKKKVFQEEIASKEHTVQSINSSRTQSRRCPSSFSWVRSDIHRDYHTLLKIPLECRHVRALWVGPALSKLPVWLAFWSLVPISSFPISWFTEMKRILRVELWGAMSSTLTTEPMSWGWSDDRDAGRMMLSLGWIFLWLVARGRIRGLNTPGRGFSLFLLTLWVLCSKLKVTDIL